MVRTITIKLVEFSDEDWAGDFKDRNSTYGYMFMMQGGEVILCSQKQSIVATSSCESQYSGISAASKESVWIKRPTSNMSRAIPGDMGFILFSDIQSVIKLYEIESINRRNKHIEITYNCGLDVVRGKQVRLRYCPTTEICQHTQSRKFWVVYCWRGF